MSQETEVTYNLPLIESMNEAKERAGISYEVMAELIGCKKSITYKYMKKTRTLVRGETERRATAVVRLLNEMTDAGILPIEEGIHVGVTDITLGVIDDYLNK